MDPTRQRRQSPFKAMLDRAVFGWTTYALPVVAAVLLFFAVCQADGSWFWRFGAPATYFWAVAYAAVSAYRRTLLLPRATDLLLDPPSEEYCFFAARQTLLALAAPLACRLLFGTENPLLLPAAATAVIGYWGAAGVSNIAYFQTQGYPNIADGVSGQRLKPAAPLREAVKRRSADLADAIPWGGLPLEPSWLPKNFLILGSVGSGKTLTLRQWLASVLPRVNTYPRWRALIVDPKWELYPFVTALLPSYKVIIINPGDARGFVWRIAEDVTTEDHIHQAAHLLLPPHKNQTQPFFENAARQLWMGTMLALNGRAPGDWWFSDLFFAVRSARRLKAILSLEPVTRDILETYASHERLFFDVFSTLDSNLADYLPIAAAWSHLQRGSPHRSVSLTDWVQGNHVLMIGKQASADAAQGRMISVLLKRASQLLLDQETGQSIKDAAAASRTIICIEEGARAGKLDILDVLTNGRDYGICVTYATQSLEAVVEHFTENGWNALASEFHSVAFLSTNSPGTARWMSERLGKCVGFRRWDNQPGRTTQPETSSATLDPTYFMTLAHGKRIHPGCVPGVFANSQWGSWYCEEGVTFPADCPGVPKLAPAEPCSLRPWDDEDLRRLNLTDVRHLLALDEPEPPRPRSGPGSRRQPPQNYPRFRA